MLKTKLLLPFLILSTVLVLGAICGEYLFERGVFAPTPDLPTYLRDEIPKNATDIDFIVGPDYEYFLDLTFSAPPGSVRDFIAHQTICNNTLYQGYEPFHAIDSVVSIPNANFLKIWPGYYSYSLNTPYSYFGTRCSDTAILIDETNPALFAVRVYHDRGCGYAQRLLPCYSLYDSFDYPVDRFPLEVTGLVWSRTNDHLLIAKEMCLETYSLFQAPDLLRANIDIFIDGKAMPPALVSDSQMLVPITSKGDKSTDGPFAYCLANNWANGIHTMTLNVSTKDGSHNSYSWNFRITTLITI